MITRNTHQRELVLRAARELANHPTPEEMYLHVRAQCPTISKGTVYRNIGVLYDEGLLRKIEIPNAPYRVDYRLENHYHILCRECGRVFDVELEAPEDLCRRAAAQQGFLIESHDILFRGLCPGCRHTAV